MRNFRHKNNIENSKALHNDDVVAIEFLETQTDLCNAIIKRAENGSQKALEKANSVTVPEYRYNLIRLAEELKKIPENPAESFYEAVLCLYFCYPFIPDSIGLIYRYLYPYYKKDIENKSLTQKEAKE